ncbi:RsmB/NOP family class I SAM-dependent RNA methyltransferase [uncultured Algimonas sp.]|uniref:RsmB/NOP family class I SAM-dependent RNA methyltransferase n=1 Tax=uncultured Algimonas sp. TaxID=1547920 RepID=UPI00260DBC78|nr:RsmB/NOP family class I SAM-dependent RNA methyltransferase [uncultured Algimonas sp.]
MRLGGRISAAEEVLQDILTRRTPVAMALRDWAKGHRFAGSKDRAAIGNIVYDALRRRSSFAYRMDDDSPRALAFAATVWGCGVPVSQLDFGEDRHAPSVLSKAETDRLQGRIDLNEAPLWVQADVPEWLWPAFENNFTDEAVLEGQALARRPPLDMRVNTLKAKRDRIETDARPTPLSPIGLRHPPVDGFGRHPDVQSTQDYQRGKLEIQDEGSQLVSLLCAAQPGDKVLDYCAGGGGKSLAIAADMDNRGALHAYDIDKRRLAPTWQRADRAGASIIDVIAPPAEALPALKGTLDRVLIDAPCTGVGTWRRKPDAKWRLTENALERRRKEQVTVLDQGSAFVRPGGFLFYVTCSMLAEENEAQVYAFLERNKGFALLSAGEVFEERFGADGPKPWSEDGLTLTLTPASTGTDGFFFAVMERQT